MEKTKITHSSERIRFLGYDIAVRRSQEVKRRKDGVKQRTLNNSVERTAPLQEKIMNYLFSNNIIEQRPDGEIWPIAVPRLRHMSEIDIVRRYDTQVRGILNYYCLAANYDMLKYFRHLMEYSCLKTLASKSQSTTAKILNKYHTADGWGIPYETKQGTKVASIAPLSVCKVGKWMVDHDPWVFTSYDPKKLTQQKRLNAGVCELCGCECDSCKVYHAGSMKRLKSTTDWGKKMLHMKRKTLIVCPDCYRKIAGN